MTAHWTARDALRDLSDQQAEHNDAMAAEAWDRDGWDNEGPSAREIASEDEWAERYWRGVERDAEWWSDAPDPWGDLGRIHHPTRFDLPVSVEPPF